MAKFVRKKRRTLGEDEHRRALEMITSGSAPKEVAEILDVSIATVYAWRTKWRKAATEARPKKKPEPKGAMAKIVKHKKVQRKPDSDDQQASVKAGVVMQEMGRRTVSSMLEGTMILSEDIVAELRSQQMAGRLLGVDPNVGGSLRLLVGAMKDFVVTFEKMGVSDDSSELAHRMIQTANRMHKLRDGDEIQSELRAIKDRLDLIGKVS